MRVIAETAVRDWAKTHARAAVSLQQWIRVCREAEWGSLAELRRTFPSADLVTVSSGRKVVVFNVAGNAFRLIAAVHFNTGMMFALRFLTHADYSTDQWKTEL
jgi:mRNA interferase HigB